MTVRVIWVVVAYVSALAGVNYTFSPAVNPPVFDAKLAAFEIVSERYKHHRNGGNITPELFSKIYDASMKLDAVPEAMRSLLVSHLIWEESEFEVEARGSLVTVTVLVDGRYRKVKQRARGLMQVMPLHRPGRPATELYDVELNLSIGVAYLNHRIKARRGDIRFALKDYNSGPGRRYWNWPYIRAIYNNTKTSMVLRLEKELEFEKSKNRWIEEHCAWKMVDCIP